MPMSEVEPFLKKVYGEHILEDLRRTQEMWDRLFPDTRTDEQKAEARLAYERERFATDFWIV